MKKCRGFTLVEIITSVVIVAILVGILTPAFKSAKRSAEISSSLQNLRQLHLGLTLYRSEWDGDVNYGDLPEMGLPSDSQFAAAGLPGIPTNRAFPSPCGELPERTALINYDYMIAEGGPAFVKTSLAFQDHLIVFADFNCNSASEPLWSEYFRHRGLGVLLDGHMVNQYKHGRMDKASWWASPIQQ
jgi:prepilin-type N-terminal cleavage/methylation domain-containing protein